MSKKRKLSHATKGSINHKLRPNSRYKPSSPQAQKHQHKHKHKQPSQDAAIVPFASKHRILLVGEADLSFAASLVTHHGCTHVTATVLEHDADELEAKYPGAARANAETVTTAGGRVLYGVDARAKGPFRVPGTSAKLKRRRKLLDSLERLDANIAPPASLAASPGGGRDNDDDGLTFDRVVFNFPHVGGKSTDVNRQVRHNQELLVSFFGRAKQSLPATGGAVVVTVFEGEPYTLWNVRDLGRHCGLRVERSFRFRADAYPGYRHARTLGVLRSQKTGDVTRGAWRGEERSARTFVFVKKEDEGVQIEGVSFVPRKKRKRGDDEEEEEEEGEEEEGEGEEEEIEKEEEEKEEEEKEEEKEEEEKEEEEKEEEEKEEEEKEEEEKEEEEKEEKEGHDEYKTLEARSKVGRNGVEDGTDSDEWGGFDDD